MPLKERGGESNNKPEKRNANGESLNEFLDSQGGDISDKERQQVKELSDIINAMVEVYDLLKVDPTNAEALKEYTSMLRVVVSGPPQLAMSILGAGIAAISVIEGYNKNRD